MFTLTRKRIRPRRKWYQRTLFQLIVILLMLASIPFYFLARSAYRNYQQAPPPGTQYVIDSDYRTGYAITYTDKGRKIWAPVCQMARNGTLTLVSNLLVRRDVRWDVIISDLYQSIVFRYTPPPTHLPPLIPEYPWCKVGFTHAVLNSTYFIIVP